MSWLHDTNSAERYLLWNIALRCAPAQLAKNRLSTFPRTVFEWPQDHPMRTDRDGRARPAEWIRIDPQQRAVERIDQPGGGICSQLFGLLEPPTYADPSRYLRIL